MPGRLLAILALGLVGLASSSASAQAYTSVAQDRTVEIDLDVFFFMGPPFAASVSESAPGFGRFQAAFSGLDLPDPPGMPGFNASYDTSASQDSWLDPHRIRAQGEIDSSPQQDPLVARVLQPASRFSTTFDLAVATPYTLEGQLDLMLCDQGGGASGRVALTGPSGTVYEQQRSLFDGYDCLMMTNGCPPISLTSSGILGPGQYTLEARVDGTISGQISPGNFCPTDELVGGYDVDLLLGATVPISPGWGAALGLGLVALGLRVGFRGGSRRSGFRL